MQIDRIIYKVSSVKKGHFVRNVLYNVGNDNKTQYTFSGVVPGAIRLRLSFALTGIFVGG